VLDISTVAATAGPKDVTVTNPDGQSSTGTSLFSVTPAMWDLAVAKAGAGSGTVSSSPAGITCGVDCTETYTANTLVSLSATPATGSVFTGWSGACTGTGSCDVTMDSNKTVTATFGIQQSTLSVANAGAGSGTVTSS